MSSFLSNFQSNDYKKKDKEEVANQTNEEQLTELEQEIPQPEVKEKITSRRSQEVFEVDPLYHRQQQKKKKIIGLLIFASLLVISVVVYQLNHVVMPDFIGQNLSEVRTWAAKNKLTVATKQVYSTEKEPNQVIKQPFSKGKKVRKGKELLFTISQGADPEEKLSLPDFNTLSVSAAEEWLEKNKAENLKIISEYSESVPQSKLLRMELKDAVTKENFKRKDGGTLYYSKGKEVYKKNILVPDFSGKLKSEVENWGRNNSIALTYKDVVSNEMEIGKVMQQSIPPKEKIAKQTKMELTLSAGKPIKVPNFAEFTPEEAQTQKNLEVTVKRQYSNDIPYGQLIWQTVPAGSELSEKSDLGITVTYSEGKPYLKDVMGETEGALQKIFFDEYQSKGANIHYTIKHVASSEKQGTVVGMSAYNTYVPLDYTVEISVSNG